MKIRESGTANDGGYVGSYAFLLTSYFRINVHVAGERRLPKAKSNSVQWTVEAKRKKKLIMGQINTKGMSTAGIYELLMVASYGCGMPCFGFSVVAVASGPNRMCFAAKPAKVSP